MQAGGRQTGHSPPHNTTSRGNRRIIFRFEEGRAFDVDLIDYH